MREQLRSIRKSEVSQPRLFGRSSTRTKKPVDPLDQLIGRNIRFYRIEKGLSQTALGEASA
jgi:hypothetical protein